jgi:Amt family ammonium transporter
MHASSQGVALSSGSNLNAGDTAWLLASTALVMLMILPGIALFYGGMCQAKNVLSTVMQTYSIACMVTIMWFAFSYSLCFSNGSAVLGNGDRFWLIGTRDTGNQKSTYRLAPTSAHALAPTIPESVFITYQLTFAIITAVLVCGSFAERMSFRAMLVFIFFWHIIVYCPVAHSEWALDGWLALKGDLDFAGGNVVHVASGLSGLAASIAIGPRRGWGVVDMKPHNIVYTVIGGALLWVGWFGFNAGSAVSAGTTAGFAMMVTQICAGTGGFVWMSLEFIHKGKASVIGIVRCPSPADPRR